MNLPKPNTNSAFQADLDLLLQGVVDIQPDGRNALEQLLTEAAKEKRQLRVKLGIDPTSSDLHIGHMVCIQKLRQFQEMGHLPVIIIGGYTAQVGDPSGRNEARPPLSADDVQNHARTYIEQVAKVIDISKAEVVNNADWFNSFSLTDIIKLASRVTVNQMISKDAFGKRISAGQPLFMHEIFYPILQGYDSVEVKSDIELGGTDQLFNLMVGRDLQRAYDQKPQLCMTMPLLVGLDGVKKMSKSYGNYIGISEDPNEIYGKTMSIPDELILDYYILAARVSSEQVQEVKYKLAHPAEFNPRDLKATLAQRLVEIYHDKDSAIKASEQFVNQFKQNQIPDDLVDYVISAENKLADLMVLANLCDSKGEAKRLIAGGGVKLDGEKLADPLQEILLEPGQQKVLQVGKRKFVRLVK
ncbi:MAG: Tyrosyl-tRNA synthetase [Cyanobacteriota bacterium]|jgi:tyrosyl-tRNA synthetase